MRDLTLSEIERLRSAAAESDAVFEMDEETFRAFYDRTARPLWVYLSRMSGSNDTADDLLQETYYRFLRADATHQGEAHRRNSLFRIATNLAHDRRRNGRRAQLVALPKGRTAVRNLRRRLTSPETPNGGPTFSAPWRG